MSKFIDADKLITILSDELKEASEETSKLHDEIKVIKQQTSTLATFTCNTRYILDKLIEAASNEQKIESIYHFIDLIKNLTGE